MPQHKPQWWNSNVGWTGATPKKGKGNGKNQSKEAPGLAFPGYDSSSGTSSASASAPSGIKEGELKAVLSAMLEEHRMEVPKELQSYLQPPLGDQLSQDQKKLNSKRKLVTKLDRLGKAMTRKQEQWTTFRNQMKEHLAKERARHEKELLEIQEAIAITQSQLDQMNSGEPLDLPAPMEAIEEELDAMLSDGKDEKKIPAMIETKTRESEAMEALRQAQVGQQLMAQQMQEMQQQILLMAQTMKPMLARLHMPEDMADLDYKARLYR